MEILMSGFERLERERPAAPRRHTPPPRDPARDDHAAADPHTLNMRAEQVRRQIVKERARAAGEPEPTFGPLSEAPDLYSPGARLERLRRQMERDRAARKAAQGEPAPASVSLPPTSTLARPLQEGPGAATAATLMRQFAAERAARAAEADAPPASIIPLRHRAVATDEAAGPVAPVEAAAATPLRQDEEHGAHGAEAVPTPLPLIPAPHADAQAPHTSTLPPLVPPAAAPVPTVPDPALHAAPTLHLAPYGAATPSGLAPLVIPSTSQQIETLRARGAGVPLDPALARAMAGGLGVDAADLAPIRLHHDPGAWALAARFGQPVYAEGNDVFFQKGAYNLGTVQGRNLLGRQLARTPAVLAAQRLRAAENAPAPSPAAPHASVAAPHASVAAPHAPVVAPVPAPAHAPIVTAALPPGDADATIVAEWQALAAEPTYRLFAALLGADPLARRVQARPPDEALATWLLGLAPGASPVNLATLRANGGLAQFVATLTREALAPGVLPLRGALAADVAAFLADPTGWLTHAQRRHEAAPGLVVDPHAVPRQQAVEFFLLRITPHLRALARAAADQAALGAAYRASGMLSLRALGAVDHAAGARVLAVGQFDVGVVAVVQRGPGLWDLVVGGVVHRFEDAAGALAAQGLSALIAVGSPGAQQLARAAGADLGRILKDPGAFFAHLATALGEGFRLFAGDLGGNLERGALQWLSGQGGLTLPALDAAGLLTFALETVGLSYASFTGDLEAAFTHHHRDGARLVAGLDTLYQYAPDLHDLAAGGPGQLAALAGHLLREVKDLDVQALVFAQVKAVLGPQLLLQVAPTLVGYLIPGADVAEAVGAVVRLIGTIVSRAAQLEAFAAAVCGAIDTIAGGGPHALTRAAGEIEGALVKAVPLVLAFAAGVVGVDVSRIGAAVLHKLHAQELVDALHKGLATLADAVAALLLKAVPPSVLARLEGHAAPEQEPGHAPAHPGPTHGGATTAAQNKAHGDLDAVVAAAVTAVDERVAASPETPLSEEEVRAILAQVRAAHHEAETYTLMPVIDHDGTHWAVRGVMVVPATPATAPTPPHHGQPHVGTQDAALALDGAELSVRAEGAGLASPDTTWTVREGTRTASGEREISEQRGTHGLVKKVEGQEVPRTVINYTWDGALPKRVWAMPLTMAPPAHDPGNSELVELPGSKPGADIPGWQDVREFDTLDESKQYKGVLIPKYWVKIHLLSLAFHGPGTKWNLVPGRGTDNKKMELGPELFTKEQRAMHPALYYDVNVTFYPGSERVPGRTTMGYFPKQIVVEVGTAKKDEHGNWAKDKPLREEPFVITLREPPSDLVREDIVDLRSAGKDTLYDKLHLPAGLCRNISDERNSYDPPRDFEGEQDFIDRMQSWYQKRPRPEDFKAVYWPEIESLIRERKASF